MSRRTMAIDIDSDEDDDDDDECESFTIGPSSPPLTSSLSRSSAPATLEGGDTVAPVTPLKQHQRAGYCWMASRESTPHRGCLGGILADEPGLGKSLQVLHLIGEHNVVPERLVGRVDQGTTVLCVPSILVENWRRQIGMHRPSLRFMAIDPSRHRQPTGHALMASLKDLDLVIVSHHQLASGWEALRGHIEAECEGEAVGEEGLESELSRDFFWGACLRRKIRSIASGGIRRDVGPVGDGVDGLPAASFLYLSGEFLRVVVDEAHSMRNDKTSVFEALRNLPAANRWYVTATPIVNYREDLFSALSFLRVEDITTRKLWRKKDNGQQAFPFGASSSSSSSPTTGGVGATTETERLLGVLMCRREKALVAEGDPSMVLPPMNRVVLESRFKHPAERALHDGLYRLCRLKKTESDERAAKKKGKKRQKKRRRPPKKKKKKRKAGREKGGRSADGKDEDSEEEEEEDSEDDEGEADRGKSYGAMLGLLLKARQCCCLPTFAESSMKEFPREAYRRVKREVAPGDVTKMRMLRAFLPQVPRGESVVLYTQWTSGMEEIASIVERHGGDDPGRRCFVLRGEMREEERWRVLDAFEATPGSCLLASLMVGSVGLTLVNANWVVFLDQWWNPAIKAQAMDRVHRQGQRREVTVVDLIVKGSVEAAIVRLQEHKRIVSDRYVVPDTEEGLERKTSGVVDEGQPSHGWVTALFNEMEGEEASFGSGEGGTHKGDEEEE